MAKYVVGTAIVDSGWIAFVCDRVRTEMVLQSLFLGTVFCLVRWFHCDRRLDGWNWSGSDLGGGVVRGSVDDLAVRNL